MSRLEGDLRDRLAGAGRAVVAAGLVLGSGGNLSARQPGSTDFWVTAAGTWLDDLDRVDFVRVNMATGAADPPAATAGQGGTGPTSELPLHLATYRARPDVNAIVHLHPQMALLLDAVGEPIRLMTTDHAYYLRAVGRVPYHPPGSRALATAAAAASADGTNCLVLSRHGCSVLADSVELAHKRAVYLEEAARLTYRAITLRGISPALDEAIARLDEPWYQPPAQPYGGRTPAPDLRRPTA